MSLKGYLANKPESDQFEIALRFLKRALPLWREFAFGKEAFEYVDSVVGTRHRIASDLIERTLFVIELEMEAPGSQVEALSALKKEFLEPATAVQDCDWEPPESVKKVFYSTHNFLERMIGKEKTFFGEPLIVLAISHAMSALKEEGIIPCTEISEILFHGQNGMDGLNTQSREEALARNRYFTQHVIPVQVALYKPLGYRAGRKVKLGGESVVLSEEQAAELNANNLAIFEKFRDINPFRGEELPKFAGEARMFPSETEVEAYLHTLGEAFEEIRKWYGASEMIFLGGWQTPWLVQENDYPPVKATLDWLKDLVDDQFNGAILLSGAHLINFIPMLFWLVRCNMDLPYIWAATENSKITFSICKNGSIHLDAYGDEGELDSIVELLEKRGFSRYERLDFCSDPIRFDGFGGRRMTV